MKKTILICGAAALVLFAVSCKQNSVNENAAESAADSTAVAGSIVYFNLDEVMKGYDMANDLNSVFETKATGIQSEIDRRGKRLEKDASEFQNKMDKGLLTSSVAQVQYQKLQQQQQEYQQYAVRKQQEMAEEQQVMMNQILDAISEFVKAYNEDKGYAMILTTSGNILSAPVVTGDASLNITKDILDGLNAEYIKSKESSK
ncbi:MAG: OmpH family outer membrane protein [Bacteroidales bacterium]|nr:OmpH family outer membrane protein [Bacteroidales bacterium]